MAGAGVDMSSKRNITTITKAVSHRSNHLKIDHIIKRILTYNKKAELSQS